MAICHVIRHLWQNNHEIPYWLVRTTCLISPHGDTARGSVQAKYLKNRITVGRKMAAPPFSLLCKVVGLLHPTQHRHASTNSPVYTLDGHALPPCISVSGQITCILHPATTEKPGLYSLDDGSGNCCMVRHTSCRLGDYVQAVGHLQPLRTLVTLVLFANQVTVISDPNMLVMHHILAVRGIQNVRDITTGSKLRSCILDHACAWDPGLSPDKILLLRFADLIACPKVNELAAKYKRQDPIEFNVSAVLHDLVDQGLLSVLDLSLGVFRVKS